MELTSPILMNLPRYKAGPVEYWLAAAFTEFVNGFIDGWGAGIGTGSVTGAFTGTTELGNDMTAIHQVFLSITAVLGAMIGNGLHQVYVWHKTQRFPNPWPEPTGTTQSPFSQSPPTP